MENSDKPTQSSEGHNEGSLDEKLQQSPKPQADSPATAGIENRDEDAADPGMTDQASKGSERDQEELELGLDDGDLDNDVQP